jgi:hypothetical protein
MNRVAQVFLIEKKMRDVHRMLLLMMHHHHMSVPRGLIIRDTELNATIIVAELDPDPHVPLAYEVEYDE